MSIFNVVRAVTVALFALVMVGCQVPAQSVTVIADVPNNQLDLYQQSLPDFLDMPAKPKLVIIGEEATGFSDNAVDYREAVIGILASYKGVERWWVLTQPLNDIAGYNSGIQLGYPKQLLDVCLDDNGRIFSFRVGCDDLFLEIKHRRNYWTRSMDFDFATAFAQGQFSVGKDNCLKESVGSFDLDPDAERRPGQVSVNITTGEPWTALFNNRVFDGQVYKGTVFNLKNEITDLACGGRF